MMNIARAAIYLPQSLIQNKSILGLSLVWVSFEML